MSVNSYEDLKVWQKSIDLVTDIYILVKNLPREELYSLSDQIRRAAVSIPSNIAEDEQRQSSKEYLKFLSIAKGSLGELKTQIIICERLGYINKNEQETFCSRCDEIGRMLNGLMKSIAIKINKSQSNDTSICKEANQETKQSDTFHYQQLATSL